MRHIKLVSVGDCDEITEKQLILFSYTLDRAFKPGDFIPTVFDNCSINVLFEETAINLQLWSTHRHEDFKKLRPLSYPQTDVFLVCFSLVEPSSLETVEYKWVPEIRDYCPDTPFILVGTKKQYRDLFNQNADEYKSKGWQPISYIKGLEMKNKLGADDYIECSTLTMENIKEVFEAAIRAVIHPKKTTHPKQQQQQEPATKKKKIGLFKLFSKNKNKKSENDKKQKDSKKGKKKDSDTNNQKDSSITKPDSAINNEPKRTNTDQANKDLKPQDLKVIKTDQSHNNNNDTERFHDKEKTELNDNDPKASSEPTSIKQENQTDQKTQVKNIFLDLNRFQLISPIGKGTFSNVWKAKYKRTNKLCAIKILKFFVDEETRESPETNSLFREVNLMSLLNHPSILKFIGYSPVNFENDPNPTIVIDYECNGSLKNIIDNERNSLSPSEWTFTKKQTTIYGIASGLQYIHAHKIIHRDLKPDNILMDEFLNPKIGDFGLSKIIDSLSASLNMVSKSGMKGTPLYMAPEVLNDEVYSEKSDVYAFAMIVYEIFSYEKPFDGLSITSIMRKVVNEGKRPPISDDIPEVYKNLIEECWDQDPDVRPTFEEIVESMKTNPDFITDLTDEIDYLDFIDFIDNSQCSFDIKNQLMHFDEFINAFGRNKEITKVKINEND